ncbi:MAG: PLP-dependent transferase [Thermoguttaceae bacterium]
MSEQAFRGLGTLAVHAGQTPDPTTLSCAVPIYATTSYVFRNTEHAANLFALREFGNIYSRLSNPTNDVLEKRLAALDGGVGALAFSSGEAAIAAAIGTIVQKGQNFISSASLYGGTFTLFAQTFAKLGVEVRFFDPAEPETISKLVDENTRAVYIEALGNPKNDVPDYRKVTDIAHRHGVPAIIDNTTLTPVQLRPIEHGFDIVVYSTTKFIAGHGVHLGGAVVDSGKFLWAKEPARWPQFTEPDPSYHGLVFEEALRPLGNIAYITYMRTHWLRDMGACQSPFGSFLTLLGLETLHLRVERHAKNAMAVAEFLEKHPAVSWVNYPGLPSHRDHANAKKYLPAGQGGIVGFGIRGGAAAGVKLINHVKLFSHLANIGDAKSLVIHPATTTHSQLTPEEQLRAGVTPEFVRLSVGIEDIDDILADLDQALKASQA